MIAVAYVIYGAILVVVLVGLVMFALIVFGAVREALRRTDRSVAAAMADLDRARNVTGRVTK